MTKTHDTQCEDADAEIDSDSFLASLALCQVHQISRANQFVTIANKFLVCCSLVFLVADADSAIVDGYCTHVHLNIPR